jgi:serine/threonine-protein kinase RsbW
MNTEVVQETVEISFPSDLKYESLARDVVGTIARRLGFEAQRICDIQSALGEAYGNAIEHGNQLDQSLRITIICAFNGEQFTLEIYDQGVKPFSGQHTMLPIDQKVAGLGPTRGLGLFMIEHLTDEAQFLSNDTGGNCLRLVWYRQRQVVEHPSD